MKKKVISAVLFGALALASTGTFVSCNDYDDEVNNLQEQINEDRAKSAALQNQLESYKAALENELKELKASYETQIAEAKAALESELQKKADATVVEALVERIVSLETGLSASVATLQSQIDVCNSAIEKLNAAIANCATVAELNAIKADAEAKLAALSGDVKRLEEQLNALSASTGESIASILANMAALQEKDAENYKALLAAIAEAKQDVETKITAEEAARIAAINDLQNQITALQAFMAAIQEADYQKQIDNLTSILNNFKAEIEAKDYQGQIDNICKDITTINGNITELMGKVATNEMSIENLKTEMAALNGKLSAMEQNFQGQINSLAVLIEKSLTSLVFKPSQYVYGFGTINVQSFTGCELLSKKIVDAGAYGKVDEYTVPSSNNPAVSTWAPSAHAKYHMNPSTADVTKYDFSFADVETKNVLTRANDEKSIGATAGKVSAENGILDVELNIAYPGNLNDAVTQTDGTGSFAWVSTLALQATEKDAESAKVITSDYALVVPSYYGNLCLANNQANPADHKNGSNKAHHLRTSAVETISDELVTFEIPYNATLDLTQYIETHYGVSSTADGEKVGDKAFTAAEFAATGMKYNYSLVSYKGEYENQASVAEISEAGVTNVQGADAKYIGQTYVVRILLQDGNNKNLAVGYVKILVTDQGADPAAVTSGIALNCENPTNSAVAMDEFVEQFKTSYSSSLTTNDFMGTKYVLDSKVYSTMGTNATEFGKGQFLLAENNLVLCLTSDEAKELFYNDGRVVPQTIKVYARFAQQAAGFSDLWVEYTIDKDKIVYAQGTFEDAKKIQSKWYVKNSKTPASAGKFDEIHANVATSVKPTFISDILSNFVGEKAYISGINPSLTNFTLDQYADLTIADTEFNNRTVKGSSHNTNGENKEYQLIVSDDNKILSAYEVGDEPETAQPVVVLTGEYNRTATYQDNPVACDILNYAAHTDLGEGETFAVEILMTQERNCYAVELTNNSFLVKFLRPINMFDLKAEPTVDAVHGGGMWYVQDLCKFTDWRDYSFNDHDEFYGFYGVGKNSIVPVLEDGKITGAKTDINIEGEFEPLDEVAPSIKLTWDPTAENSKINGKIGYENNGFTVNRPFHIQVPMNVYYAWGKIETVVTLTIAPTINNLPKK